MVWQVMESAQGQGSLRNRLNDTFLQLILYDIIILPQDGRSLPQSVQQSLKPVVAKLVVVWEGLMEILPWQQHFVSAILKGDSIDIYS